MNIFFLITRSRDKDNTGKSRDRRFVHTIVIEVKDPTCASQIETSSKLPDPLTIELM